MPIPMWSTTLRYFSSDVRRASSARRRSVMSMEFPRMAGRPWNFMPDTVSMIQRISPPFVIILNSWGALFPERSILWALRLTVSRSSGWTMLSDLRPFISSDGIVGVSRGLGIDEAELPVLNDVNAGHRFFGQGPEEALALIQPARDFGFCFFHLGLFIIETFGNEG